MVPGNVRKGKGVTWWCGRKSVEVTGALWTLSWRRNWAIETSCKMFQTHSVTCSDGPTACAARCHYASGHNPPHAHITWMLGPTLVHVQPGSLWLLGLCRPVGSLDRVQGVAPGDQVWASLCPTHDSRVLEWSFVPLVHRVQSVNKPWSRHCWPRSRWLQSCLPWKCLVGVPQAPVTGGPVPCCWRGNMSQRPPGALTAYALPRFIY